MYVDYSLYLVTDSTPAILGDKDLANVVSAALDGGVTIVQYRDKSSETADIIRMAERLHGITSKHNIPLLINDRVDIVLAVGAEGVHLGQDDMDISTARKLLGPDAIIGITCTSLEEAYVATKAGANYLGLGTVFATPTKENTKSIIGIQGTRKILEGLSASDKTPATVAIGGINASNVQRIMYQTRAASKSLDGPAVVSAIIASKDAKSAAQELRRLLGEPPAFATAKADKLEKVDALLKVVPAVVTKIGAETPLCHNMTNLVVQNFAANVALAIGASPIMANYGEEAEDLAKVGGALVINMGTVTPDGIKNFLQSLKAYNTAGGPVLLDPVGAGATKIRREAVKTLLNGGYFDVIKGNENELNTILGQTGPQQKGVDSSNTGTSAQDKARIAKKLAARERNVVVLTGATDYLSDGQRTYAIGNGSHFLSRITGSGCTLGTTIASFLAVHKEDKLLAALAGILVFEIASEHAAKREDVKGPGSFVPAFLDELCTISTRSKSGDWDWLAAARVEVIHI